MFVVLTGENGSGKTQLLETIAYALGDVHLHGVAMPLKVEINGDNFSQADIAYYSTEASNFSAHAAGVHELRIQSQNLFQSGRQQLNRQDAREVRKRARIERLLGRPLQAIKDADELERLLGKDYAYLLDDVDVLGHITFVFFAYRLRWLERLEQGKTSEEIINELGPAPWDVLNKAFETAGFRYRVVSPRHTSLSAAYTLQFDDPVLKKHLNLNDLSSGEKVICQVIGWLYNSQHHHRFPRFLLMDEPDAHLHPSMTQQFMDVVQGVLVDTYQVRVIMTTHSPSTVALAPDGSIYEMSRDEPRLRPSQSKAQTLGLLTSGLLTVSKATRYVFVEDERDMSFYEVIRGILTDYGPRKDPHCLKPAPSVVFMAASLGEGADKVPGGSSIVLKWIEKFDAAPLNEHFRGLIDKDMSNTGTERVKVLGRYSVENYLVDPVIVFGLLSSESSAPEIHGSKITPGNEFSIPELDEMVLQTIINEITSSVEAASAGALARKALQKVVYTNGKNCDYPDWQFATRGHDLLRYYQMAFGQNVITPPRLMKLWQQVRLVPAELATIFRQLQSD